MSNRNTFKSAVFGALTLGMASASSADTTESLSENQFNTYCDAVEVDGVWEAIPKDPKDKRHCGCNDKKTGLAVIFEDGTRLPIFGYSENKCNIVDREGGDDRDISRPEPEKPEPPSGPEC